jgi:putative flippase GtrA
MARSRGVVGAIPRLRMLTSHPEALRAFSFLVVGGICAVFNLAVLSALTLLAGWTYLFAVLVATEASVMLGFVLNDRFTFRALAEHAGEWLQRCVRFHLAAAAGQALTILLGFALLHTFARAPIHPTSIKPILAQAISLVIVTIFNFVAQRFLTYASRSAPVAATTAYSQTTPAGRSLPHTQTSSSGANPARPVAGPVSMYDWARLRSLGDD